jgi:hypothetical protein
MKLAQFRDNLDGLYRALCSWRGCQRRERPNEIRSVVYWLGLVQTGQPGRMTERDRARLGWAIDEARRAIDETHRG